MSSEEPETENAALIQVHTARWAVSSHHGREKDVGLGVAPDSERALSQT